MKLAKIFMKNMLRKHLTRQLSQCLTLSAMTTSWPFPIDLTYPRMATKPIVHRRKHDSYHTTLSVTLITTKCWHRRVLLGKSKGTTKFGWPCSFRSGIKSDILEFIKAPTGRSSQARRATIVVVDMAAVIHMMQPTSAKHYCRVCYTTYDPVPEIHK